jgi:tetratricopeptide (TPR) repeat protein
VKVGWSRRASAPEAVITAADDLIVADDDRRRLAFMRKAARRYPGDARVRLRYAIALIPVARDKVPEQLARAIELDPNNPAHLVRAAALMIDHGEAQTASEWVQRANELAPPDFALAADLKALTAVFADVSGDPVAAERMFDAALAADPASEIVVLYFARFLAKHSRRAEALDLIDQAILAKRSSKLLERLRRQLATGTDT